MAAASIQDGRIGKRLPDKNERRSANSLREILSAQKHLETGELNVRLLVDDRPTTITLSPGVSELLLEALGIVGSGDAVMLVPVHRELTTQQAADILDVSRPHLIKLLDRGDMPHRKVGRHRRVDANDVFAHRERMAMQCEEALSRLAEEDPELI